MTIYIGADHGGFALKESLKATLTNEGYDVADLSSPALAPDDDYPDIASAVAKQVGEDGTNRRGIVICHSGFGVDIVANKFNNVRAALAMSPDHVYQGRHDDDVNVLALAADFVDEPAAQQIMKVFLTTPFAREERYLRRIEKIARLELDR